MLLTLKGSHRQHALDLLQRHVELPRSHSIASPCERPKYLELYHKIDIALDPGNALQWPHHHLRLPLDGRAGGHAGRTDRSGSAGLSELMNLSLPEWVAFTSEQYM